MPIVALPFLQRSKDIYREIKRDLNAIIKIFKPDAEYLETASDIRKKLFNWLLLILFVY